MLEKFKSRKFIAALIGALAPVVCAYLSEEVALWDAIQASTAIIISYIWGQGAVDAFAAKG